MNSRAAGAGLDGGNSSMLDDVLSWARGGPAGSNGGTLGPDLLIKDGVAGLPRKLASRRELRTGGLRIQNTDAPGRCIRCQSTPLSSGAQFTTWELGVLRAADWGRESAGHEAIALEIRTARISCLRTRTYRISRTTLQTYSIIVRNSDNVV
jgi:hypothetical protein